MCAHEGMMCENKGCRVVTVSARPAKNAITEGGNLLLLFRQTLPIWFSVRWWGSSHDRLHRTPPPASNEEIERTVVLIFYRNRTRTPVLCALVFFECQRTRQPPPTVCSIMRMGFVGTASLLTTSVSASGNELRIMFV